MAVETFPRPALPQNDGFRRLAGRRTDTSTDAIITKLVAPAFRSQHSGRVNQEIPDLMTLQSISNSAATNINDANALFQLLPDSELALQILASTILSPKDLTVVELNYSVETDLFNSELSSAMLRVVRGHFETVYRIKDLLPRILNDVLMFTGSYPLLVLPESAIDEAINSQGRVTLESLGSEMTRDGKFPHLGLLGSEVDLPTATAVTLESFFSHRSTQRPTGYTAQMANIQFPDGDGTFDPKLTVVDNLNVLKGPRLLDKMRQDHIQDVLQSNRLGIQTNRVAVEAFGQTTQSSLYQPRRFKNVPVVQMRTARDSGRETVGNPLVMRLPPESVIPVHVPSSPEDHLAYYVLLDHNGNPLNKTNETDYYSDMSNHLSSNQQMVSQLIGQVAKGTSGTENTHVRRDQVDQLTNAYTTLVENNLLKRLKNGAYGENVALGRPEEVYRIMLSRALSNQQTQVLLIPRELLTYFAFDYDQFGMGVSLMQATKIIAGLRAIMLFGNTQAALANSVGHTVVTLNLSDKDPDPFSTVRFMTQEYARGRQGMIPLGMTRPHELVSHLQNAGVQFVVTGNKAYPETTMNVEGRQANNVKPDMDFDTELRMRHLQGYGLSPETVDQARSPEFATSVVNNNLMLSKRARIYQEKLEPQLEHFIRNYSLNSQDIMDELRELVEDNEDMLSGDQEETQEEGEEDAAVQQQNQAAADSANEAAAAKKKAGTVVREGVKVRVARGKRRSISIEDVGVDAVVMEFLNALRVRLPRPDVSTGKAQLEAYREWNELLDICFESFLSADFLTADALGEDVSNAVTGAIAGIKASYRRQYLSQNNIMPELQDLMSFNDENGPALNMLDIHKAHIEGVGRSIVPYLVYILKKKGVNEEVIGRLAGHIESTNMAGGSGDTFGADDFSGGGGGFGDTSGFDDPSGGQADAFAVPATGTGDAVDLPDDVDDPAADEIPQ